MVAVGRDARSQRRRSAAGWFGESFDRELLAALDGVKLVDVLSAGLAVAAILAEIVSPSTGRREGLPGVEEGPGLGRAANFPERRPGGRLT
jgi:hypothetical protein